MTRTQSTTENHAEIVCVYREVKHANRTIDPLAFYCPRCCNRVRTDNSSVEEHTYDDSFRMNCPDCGLRLNERVTLITEKSEWSHKQLKEGYAREALLSYWNRAMRYGWRLGDRIAVDARASEFEYYADKLDIEWTLECPLFRLQIDDLDNEGLDDTEFNHSVYEEDDGRSKKQNAPGFTLSRAAHDYVHYNLPGWVGKYYLFDGLNIQMLDFQAYRIIQLEHKFWEAQYGETKITDEQFLTHVTRRYDYEQVGGVEWLRQTYHEVEEVIEEVHEAYDDAKDYYAGKMAKDNIKGMETKKEALDFLNAKEERIEEYLDRVDEMLDPDNDTDEWTQKAGWSTPLAHPVTKA